MGQQTFLYLGQPLRFEVPSWQSTQWPRMKGVEGLNVWPPSPLTSITPPITCDEPCVTSATQHLEATLQALPLPTPNAPWIVVYSMHEARQLTHSLSACARTRLTQIRNPDRYAQSLAVRQIAHAMLGALEASTDASTLHYDEDPPYEPVLKAPLSPSPTYWLSFTHTRQAVAVGLSLQPIAIDLEARRRVKSPRGVVRFILGADAANAFDSLVQQNAAQADYFYALWGAWECTVKLSRVAGTTPSKYRPYTGLSAPLSLKATVANRKTAVDLAWHCENQNVPVAYRAYALTPDLFLSVARLGVVACDTPILVSAGLTSKNASS